jgi:putative zinc finger/helix-turn-helix YgiT family protein
VTIGAKIRRRTMNRHYCETCGSDQVVTIRDVEKKFTIKGKIIKIKSEVATCNNCSEEVYDADLSQELTEKAICEYNSQYGVSSTDIKDLREYYSISAATLAKIVGCAKKTIFSYEHNLSVPSDTHMTVLKFITQDFENLKSLAEINKIKLSTREQNKVFNKKKDIEDIIFPYSNQYNGYVDFCYDKFINVFLAILGKGLGKTKLAKGLFVLDFNSYNEKARSITGLTYAKMPRGPMPNNFTDLLDYLQNKKLIKVETTFEGDITNINIFPLQEADTSKLEEFELDLIDRAKSYIQDKTASELSELSHEGLIWNSTDNHRFISYDKVKNLKMKI